MTPNANEPARVKRKVFWLLLILVAVISLGFMVLGSQPLDQQLASIGANILAAAAYAAVFTLLLERESQTWLDSRLGERLDAKFDAQQQWLERRQAEHEAAVELTIGGGPLAPFAPSQVFEGRNVFDRGFLEAITDEMRESQQLWFRGSAGKFLAPYVTGLGLRSISLHVLLLDPRDDAALRLRARDMAPSDPESVLRQRVDDLRHDVYRTVVALHGIRGDCPNLEVGFTHLTSVTRIECLDSGLYLGVHASRKYPDILRFAKDSTLYTALRMEVVRQMRDSRPVNLRDIESDEDLLALLESHGLSDASPEALQRLRKECAEFEISFRRRCEDEAGFTFKH